jgi:molecular chaperone DnaK
MKIGIDIGNSYATIATLNHEGEPVLIKDIESNKDWEVFTPMRVQIEDQFAYIGQTVNSLMASKYQLNYCKNFFEELGNPVSIYTDDSKGEWTAVELVGLSLRKLKIDAEGFSTELLEGVVAVVPSYFSEAEKAAYQDAFKWSGVRLQGLVEDYKAALAGYGFSKNDAEVKNILVYDFGKTQFHFNIVRCGGGKIELIFSSKKIEIGGKLLDNEVATIIKSQYKQVTGNDFKGSLKEQYYLDKQAELIKARLSSPFLPYTKEICVLDNKPIEVVINRATFETAIDKIVQRTIEEIEIAFQQITIEPEAINHVLLIGGSGKITLVQKKLQAFLGKGKKGIICELPRKVMTKGAALLAYEVSEEVEVNFGAENMNVGGVPYAVSLSVQDVVTEQLVEQDYFLKGDELPANRTEIFSTFFPGQKNIKIKVIKNKFLGDLLETLGIIDVEIPDGKEIIEMEVAANFDKKGELSFSVREKGTGKFLYFQYIKGTIIPSPKKVAVTRKHVRVVVGKKKNAVKNQAKVTVNVRSIDKKKPAITVAAPKVNVKLTSKEQGKVTVNATKKQAYENKKIVPEERIKEMIINNIG